MDISELANFTPRQPLASSSSQSNFPLDPQLLSQGPSTSSRNYWDEEDPLEYHEEEDYASGSQEGESEEETDAEEEFAQSQQTQGVRSKRGRASQGGLLREDGSVDKGKGKARAVDQDADNQEEGEDLGSVSQPHPLTMREVKVELTLSRLLG